MALTRGMKTSEFAISLALFLVGVAVLFVDYYAAQGTLLGKGLALLVSTLGTLGYAIPRAQLKKRDLEAEATKALAEAQKVVGNLPGNPS